MNAGRRAFLRCALGLGAPAFGAGRAGADPTLAAAAPRLVWRERVALALGTTTWLRAAHAEPAVAEQALADAAAAVAQVDAALSLFRPDRSPDGSAGAPSALMRLNREGELREPPALLVAALRLARRAAQASGGTFDPSVQPLWRTWYEAHLQGRVPAQAELAAARARVGFAAVHIDERLLRLPRAGMALTLNGIAQGIAADEARRALRRRGIEHALVDTGEWWPLGQSSEGGAWRLGVAQRHRDGLGSLEAMGAAHGSSSPALPSALLATLACDGRAVACSADSELSFTADRREHHILDPRSGHSPRQLAMVVVLAHSAAWADAMSKPLMMGSASEAVALAPRLGCDVLAVEKGGRWRASAGVRLA